MKSIHGPQHVVVHLREPLRELVAAARCPSPAVRLVLAMLGPSGPGHATLCAVGAALLR